MNKEEAKMNAKKVIDDMSNSITRLEEKATNVSESVGNEIENEVQVLKLMKEDIKVKYQKFENENEDSMADIQKAFDDITKIFKETASKLEDRF